MKTHTITLTVDEFNRLMSISDDNRRKQAAKAITTCATTPDAAPASHGDETVSAVTRRMQERRERARRAAERRKARREQGKQELPKAQFQLRMTEGNVRRLLWLKQHFTEWLENVVIAFDAVTDWSIGPKIATTMEYMCSLAAVLLRPMTDAAAAYMKTPRRMRPATMTLTLPTMAPDIMTRHASKRRSA